MTSQDTVDTLNDLIETCKDGEHGFTIGARLLDSAELSILFMIRAGGCQRAAAELQTFLIQYGGRIEQSAEVSAGAKRRWAELENVLAGFGDEAVLDHCERVESEAIERYRDVLDDDGLPESLRGLIERQFQSLRKSHQQTLPLRARLQSISQFGALSH
ncbi:MAG: hypothetical protein RLZZ618_148 [Pseudomonadota bacterium]|jgi:uncharacterized protein (TIGR02284 family)